MAIDMKGMYYSEFERRGDHVALFVVREFRELISRPKDPEIAASGFFPLDKLPEGTSPATKRRLAELADHTTVSERW
jgi:hypothetical protein